ncbi:MAG: 50S ribosomal protein L3 [Deltaproteobacteria bacterium]
MGLSLVGVKCGMTGFFEDTGVLVPVTVIKVFVNYVIGIKTLSKDGYCAVKIASILVKEKKLPKSLSVIYKKLGIDYCKYISEFKINESEINGYFVGKKLDVNLFSSINQLNVCGITKGRGFTGVIKRHNFKSQRASHGNSLSHRAPGSIGQCQSPGRVFPGKKLPGRYGATSVTIKNLDVVKIYLDKGIILLKGAVPGFRGSKVFLKFASN